VKYLNDAVDKVRRREVRQNEEFKNTKCIFLKNPENQTEKQRVKFESITAANYEVSRAWREGKEYFLYNDVDEDDIPGNQVSGMAVNSEGKIYLTGQSFTDSLSLWGVSHHLTEYNTYTGEKKVYQVTSGELCIPGCMISQPRVKVGERNRIYVTTFYCQKLLVFDKSCNPLKEIFLADYSGDRIFPQDVAAGNNRVYIADASEKLVLIFEER
jgi:hypothetical protein